MQALQEEAGLVAALRRGEEEAFTRLLDAYGGAMRRLALGFVRNPAVADEVVQEAWLGVLRGIGRFEGRASLKTWIFTIVANAAKTRAIRESRSRPFSSFEDEAAGDDPTVDPSRFENPRFPGGWTSFPEQWTAPEERLLAGETRSVIEAAIAELPPAQRAVISLRDVEGWEADEVCNVLELSESNQRVLLHRARARVRAALEGYLT